MFCNCATYIKTSVLCTLTTVCTTHILHRTKNATTQNYKLYYRKLQIVLHKTTNHVAQNYISCCIILQTELHAHALHTSYVCYAMYNNLCVLFSTGTDLQKIRHTNYCTLTVVANNNEEERIYSHIYQHGTACIILIYPAMYTYLSYMLYICYLHNLCFEVCTPVLAK